MSNTPSPSKPLLKLAAGGAATVAACGLCCGGPVLAVLGGISVASLAAAIVIPALAVLAVLAAATAFWLWRRRRATGHAAAPTTPTDLGLPGVASSTSPGGLSPPATPGLRR